MARANQTPNPVWSDGIHFVRPASKMDDHVMRWVISYHKATASTFKRRAKTRDEAVKIARRATKVWLKKVPADKVHVNVPTLPEASTVPKVKHPPFSINGFRCIYANPYAQVWQRQAEEDMPKPVGRPRKDGSAPLQSVSRHGPNNCAILIGDEPVRDPDGQVTVFPNRYSAEEEALDLYQNADEELVISWIEGSPKVYATERVDILFDPFDKGTEDMPFILWLPEFGREVFYDRKKPSAKMQKVPTNWALQDAQKRLELEEQRRRERNLMREDALTDQPFRFRSIVGAIEEAYRRERMLRGETVR